MTYKGVEVVVSKYGTYHLFSPVNGTRRIFNDLEMAKKYIDNCKAIDSHAMAMR